MSNCKKAKKADECQMHQFQRNNYFYGKLMTVRDFEDEQTYMNEKRHLLNRSLHGAGIVCGFTKDSITVSAEGGIVTITFNKGGFAVDGCGREIVVPAGISKKIKNQELTKEVTSADLNNKKYLYIKRRDCYGEMVAAASAASGCEEKCCPNRIIEDFVVYISDKAPTPLKCDEVKDVSHLTECPEKETDGVFIGSIKNQTFNPEENLRIYLPNSVLLDKRIECHIDDKNNPHKLKHSQLLEVLGIDSSKTNTTRDKHVSNADAKRWNSALYKIKVNDSLIVPDSNGAIAVESGENVNIIPGEHKFTISVSVNGGNYKEFPENRSYHELSQNGEVTILHGFKRYPVVDVYEVREGFIIVLKKEINNIAKKLHMTVTRFKTEYKVRGLRTEIERHDIPYDNIKVKEYLKRLVKYTKKNYYLSHDAIALENKPLIDVVDNLYFFEYVYLRKIIGSGGSPSVEVIQENKEVVTIHNKTSGNLKIKVILTA